MRNPTHGSTRPRSVASASVNEPQAITVPSSDGVTVVAHDHGGDGPPLVFCHATGFCGRYWDPICRRLADRWRCIAIDLRGHGDSLVPAGVGYDWLGMADDVLAVIDGLGLATPVAAVGHSMGGCAIVLAELARPGTIGGAWLFEPILIPADGGGDSSLPTGRTRWPRAPGDGARCSSPAMPPTSATHPGPRSRRPIPRRCAPMSTTGSPIRPTAPSS